MHGTFIRLFRRAGGGLLAAAFALYAGYGWACEGLTVGSALFQNRRQMHTLVVIGPTSDPETENRYEELLSWTHGAGEGLNLSVQRISVDDPGVVWSDHGFEGPPDADRMTVLVSRHPAGDVSFIVDRWEPEPSREDMAVLRDSPLRERLRAETVSKLAVFVHSAGAEAAESRRIGQLLQELARRWKAERGHDIAILELDRLDPRERALVRFTQLNEIDEEWVGVFAGRGVMLFPPFKGEDITQANLDGLLDKLAGPCTCIVNPYALGVEIPILWTDADERLVSELAVPLYSEQVVGAPFEEDAGGSDIMVASPHFLVTGAVVAGMLCLVPLGVTAFAWWQYRRRNSVNMEDV